jgi:hypothetical protein
MRTSMLATIGAAGLSLAALVPVHASAAAAAIARLNTTQALHSVQYWGAGPQPGYEGWQQRRQWRQQQDEARVAEAARREAMQIEREREQRRAWHRAQREHQYGYGPGYYRY